MFLGLHDVVYSLMFSNKPKRDSQALFYTEVQIYIGGPFTM